MVKSKYLFAATISLSIGLITQIALGGSDCDLARERLDQFFQAQPSMCKVDSDCGSYYYRETCRGPVVLSKAVANADFENKLNKFKEKIKIDIACAEEWKQSPACSPTPSFPKCKAGHCI